ncbi:unnamed protein product, partial [Porites lobata]
EFEEQRDQGAPVRDIFKSPCLANTRKLLRLQPYDPTNRNPPGKDIEVVDALSKLSTESHEPIPEMNVQTHVVFPQLVIKCCKRSKNRANLEAKLGALKEMISEGWLTHIQQHLTLLKPN